MSTESGTRLRCPICQVVDTEAEFAQPRGPARTYPLVRCRRCGLVFLEELRDISQLDEAQSTAYGEPQKRFTGGVEMLVRLFRKSRVRLAERLVPPTANVLDVGCGRGLFLELMRDRGHRVQGTELSAATAHNASPDLPISVGDLEPGQYPDNSLDLVSIWHVLEHLRFPDRALHAAWRALRPGGRLLLALPNYASTQSQVGGEYWFHLDLPRHIFQFTDQTLVRLVRKEGFEIEVCRTGQWEMDPFGLLQSALNRAGLRYNALYDTIRNSPEHKRDLSLIYRLCMLALVPPGFALALPLSLLFRLTGRAGTLILIARKPLYRSD
ncbi:MAG: class I SAM-dependent methyltransferase [Planctomycetes bacterium]|nr:class I SAM-dependent methyltransferase [Planctomycetota bacterium]